MCIWPDFSLSRRQQEHKSGFSESFLVEFSLSCGHLESAGKESNRPIRAELLMTDIGLLSYTFRLFTFEQEGINSEDRNFKYFGML